MRIYTVHEPPLRRRETAVNPDRFAFVRDGFHFWAFLLGPLWMLWHRLWLALLIYVVLTTALHVGLFALGVSGAATFAVGFLIALLIGFEAATLRRWTYTRRGWQNLGPVVAPNLEAAEHRFFNSWVPRAVLQASQPPTMPIPASSPEVIGLFPEPQSRP
jgi:uncharacterized protein DUF2628